MGASPIHAAGSDEPASQRMNGQSGHLRPPSPTGPAETTSSSRVQIPPSKPSCVKCRPPKPPSSSSFSSKYQPPSDTTVKLPSSHHVTTRHYIGPLPVPASTARAVARAMIEDDSCQIPTPYDENHETEQESSQHAADGSWEKVELDNAQDASAQHEPAKSGYLSPAWTNPFSKRRSRSPGPSPKSALKDVDAPSQSTDTNTVHSALGRPRRVDRDPSTTSVLSNASYVSAQSIPRSAISDTEAANRQHSSFDARSPPTTSDDPSETITQRSASPSKQRFARFAKQRNQSFPANINAKFSPKSKFQPLSGTGTPSRSDSSRIGSAVFEGQPQPQLQPPQTKTQNLLTIPSRSVYNVRSAENLRTDASVQNQRRIGSEGSTASKMRFGSTPPNGSVPLPLLDLPLQEMDETSPSLTQDQFLSRVGDSGMHYGNSDQMMASTSTEPSRLRKARSAESSMTARIPAAQRSALYQSQESPVQEDARRSINGSNDTSIVKPDLRPQSPMQHHSTLTPKPSVSDISSRDSSYGKKKGSALRQGLLHPTWARPVSAHDGTFSPKNDPDDSMLSNGDAGVREEGDHQISFPSRSRQPSHDRSEMLKERARSKFSQAHVGMGVPKKRSLSFDQDGNPQVARLSSAHLGIHLPRSVDHTRETSRQSRMSRASTAGTFNTVGTIVTDGSFGASGGNATLKLKRKILAGSSLRRRADSVQSRGLKAGRQHLDLSSPSTGRTRHSISPFVVRRLHPRSASQTSIRKNGLPRQLSFATDHYDAGLSSSATNAKGVPPGAVGTSAGGTKWVGQSFEVGKRFWDILEGRRAELVKSQPCTCDQQVEGSFDGIQEDLDPKAREQEKAAEHRASEVAHMKKSPDGVITLLAQEAQGASDEKTLNAQSDSAEQRGATMLSPVPSVKPVSNGHAAAQGSEMNHTVHPNPEHAGRRTMDRDGSVASIVSMPQGNHEPFSIEARTGWSDIISKMSSVTAKLDTSPAPRIVLPGQEPRKNNSNKRQTTRSADNAEESHSKQVVSLDSAMSRNVPDQNLKILARSSSLLESDRASTDSKHTYTSSAEMNGHAQRTSSLAQPVAGDMTRQDVLSHPTPPAVMEDKDPQLLHELLRRKSDLGTRPDVVSLAASDDAVAAQPVSSPIAMTPTTEQPSHSDQSGMQLREQKPLPIDSNADDELEASRQGPLHRSSSLLKPATAGTSPQRRKTVKFEAGSSRPNRITASLFAGKSEAATEVQPDLTRTSPGDAAPRPPEEVLARPQPNVLQPNQASPHFVDVGSPTSECTVITRKTVLKKDRMLVKLAWTPDEDLPKQFDELQSRRYPIRDENWREYVVVFRMGKLELWSDPTFTNKLVGRGDHLKLRHTIPLSRGNSFMSLFSPIDRIFCITFQPWRSMISHQSRRGIHLRRHGTEIALFDCRARSTAADWMWELWRELGGLIPETLEVHVPSFGLKVKIPVPEEMPIHRPEPANVEGSKQDSNQGLLALTSIGHSQDAGEGFKLINRTNIIAMTWKVFSSIPEWKELMAFSEKNGIRMELAWRRGMELDWVINERTVENEPRHWAVLCGSLLRDYKNPSILELRVATHYPTSVMISPGQFMQEPPAIEGYLWRVKPVSNALTRLYLTSYDGHLYVCRTSRAFPPDRHLAVQMKEAIDMRVPRTSGTGQPKQPEPLPSVRKGSLSRALAKFVGREKIVRRDEDMAALRQNVLEAIIYPAETEEEFKVQIDAYRSFERRRQFEQIRGSDGFIDLKSIYMIKTIGSGPVRCPGMDEARDPSKQQKELRKLQNDAKAAQREGEESETEEDSDVARDIGGEEGLSLAADRANLKRSRQIEVTLANGKSIRFEAFSASVAREWVEKISELVLYWRRRERADATELMYASGIDLTEHNKRLQGRSNKAAGMDLVDEQKLLPVLGNIWNWCAIEGCRNVIKSGRLFHKKSAYGAFKSRDYVLIAGRLLCFKLVRSVRTSRSRQNNGIFRKRQDTVIHLRDAYVYSGKLTEDMLQSGRSDPAQAVSGIGGGGSNSGERHRIPRVYADGSFSTDEDEDCTFVIRYRPERVNTPADPVVPTHTTSEQGKPAVTAATSMPATNVPTLDDKTHIYIALRARSKIERDLWVRCIAYEIERIVRDDVDRETKLKNTGKVDLKK